jgi:hypothetical protein
MGVPPLHPRAESPASLDLLISLNEPESLVRELRKIATENNFAGEHNRKCWQAIARMCERTEEVFEIYNRPKANRPHGSGLGGDLAP